MPPGTSPVDGELFDSDKGFMNYNIDRENGIFFIQEICGDLKHWFNIAKESARLMELNRIIGVSKLSERAICRMLKCQYIGHLFEMEV